MADEKKYKYTVKRFAKMLTVHPDKRVTFQDTVDIRDLVRLQASHNELIANPPANNSLPVNFSGVLSWLATIEAVFDDRNGKYFQTLTEYGELIDSGDESAEVASMALISVVPPFGLRFEVEVAPKNLAAWLAATGFPQISRAKEEDNGNANVAK